MMATIELMRKRRILIDYTDADDDEKMSTLITILMMMMRMI